MISMKLKDTNTLSQEVEMFLAEIEQWSQDCIHEFADAKPTDVHDQGTYTTGWEPYYQATGDPRIHQFMTVLRDQISNHFTETGLWRHGYWTMQEAHHGTEHYELFLGTLLRMNPEDGKTIRQLDDAAEHMGNWSEAVPDWFDHDAGLYHSMHFGADGITLLDGTDLNLPDHLRCININLLAYQGTGNSRYLEHSRLYGELWAKSLLSQHELPIGITRNGVILNLSNDSDKAYRSFVGQLPDDMNRAVDRAENFLASGGIDTLLQLYQYTKKVVFRHAIEKLLDILVLELNDPDAGAAADMIRKYRKLTGSERYDAQIIAAVRSLAPFEISELSLSPPPVELKGKPRPSGIGKRSDMPLWLENKQARQHNPILLALASEITDDQALAARSIQLARTYVQLARIQFTHGREHGCKAPTVSAIARGHGRDNHSGMTTAVLAPIIAKFALK